VYRSPQAVPALQKAPRWRLAPKGETGLKLAKQALDVGFYTDQLDASLAFWQQVVQAPFREMLPLGQGLRQHRHAIDESVLKINHARDGLPMAGPCGYRGLTVARPDLAAARQLTSPEGTAVTLVPAGTGEISQLEVTVVVSHLERHRQYWGKALALPEAAPGVFAAGASRVRLQQGEAVMDPLQRAVGFRYLTLQVFDVREAHAAVIAAGGTEGMAPVRLGDVAHISFVRDPDGNWLELSQRKSITGTLN
jgi:lactoylglutathione lyase